MFASLDESTITQLPPVCPGTAHVVDAAPLIDSLTVRTAQVVSWPWLMVIIARLSSVASVGMLGASFASKVYRLSVPSVFDSANPAAQTYNVPASTTVIATIKIVAITGLTALSSSLYLRWFDIGYSHVFLFIKICFKMMIKYLQLQKVLLGFNGLRVWLIFIQLAFFQLLEVNFLHK